MTSSLFLLSNELPMTVKRARNILGYDVADMNDEDIENMIRSVSAVTDVVISVIDDSNFSNQVGMSDCMHNNG